ncbi:Protein ssh4 [Zancudomyces culisetae]|uniref:Protein ssh4 n=1 Tax=Zancudomyces culisetae TaxID=1213189 RepID=A0A1R1PNI5_ZANCU|nr:Protein ssh4 [Zancudomyces culisetae]|eukprot:OMH82462.1 Protein ssh4 [Zancudomyces culisetae]
MARLFEQRYPHGTVNTEITREQALLIHEKGVGAWQLEADLSINALVQDKTEVLLMGGDNCIQSNLPIPKSNSTYYFEVKITEKPADVNMWIGVATKPYPYWRMVGMNKYSVGYNTSDGKVHNSTPFRGVKIGEKCIVGDTIGVGHNPRAGYVWFTHNGRRYSTTLMGLNYDLFPSVSADGPCSFSVNFGQRGFVFIEANVKKWGLAPIEGCLLPPPTYGADHGTVLLDAADDLTAENNSGSVHENDPSSSDNVSITIRNSSFNQQGSSNNPRIPNNAPQTAPKRFAPPNYQEDDPIAIQILEAKNTRIMTSSLKSHATETQPNLSEFLANSDFLP